MQNRLQSDHAKDGSSQSQPSSSSSSSSSSLYRRIKNFLSRPKGQIPPKQMSFECEYFMKEACKLQTIKGFQYAHDLLHKLIEEKNYANDIFLKGQGKDKDKDKDKDKGKCKQGHIMNHESGDSGSDGTISVSATNNISTSQFIVKDSFFHIVMFGWARSKRKEGPSKIQQLMKMMEREHDIDVRTKELFTIINHNHLSGSRLHIGMDESDISMSMGMGGWTDERTKRVTCLPSTASYNILLTALANTSSKENYKAAIRAEQILSTMWDLHNKHSHRHTKPNTRTYEIIIEAYRNSHTFNSGKNARRVFHDMVHAHEKDITSYRLNSLSGSDYNFNDEESNYRHIIKPTTKAVKDVAFAYIDGRGTVQSAEVFLKDCILLNKEGNGYSGSGLLRNVSLESLLLVVLKAYEKVAQTAKHPKARYEAAQRAETLLLLLTTKQFISTPSRSIRTGSGNDGKINSKGQKQKLTGTLKPSIVAYNLCLNAWAQSDVRESSPRAQSLMLNMMNLNVTPDRTSFHTVMTALSRSFPYDDESAQKTEAMIKRMYVANEAQTGTVRTNRSKGNTTSDNDVDTSVKPTSMTYAIAIEAWAKSSIGNNDGAGDDSAAAHVPAHKSIHARRLLDELLRRYVAGEAGMEPTIHAYTSVLKACASSNINLNLNYNNDDEKKDILMTAINTYEEVRNDDGMTSTLVMDNYFFSTMIRAICHLLPEGSNERLPLLGRVYNDSKRDKQVSEEIRRLCTENEGANFLKKAL